MIHPNTPPFQTLPYIVIPLSRTQLLFLFWGILLETRRQKAKVDLRINYCDIKLIHSNNHLNDDGIGDASNDDKDGKTMVRMMIEV